MKRIAVISHSFLRNDPRVGRAVHAFLEDGWYVDGLFLDDAVDEERLRTWRVSVRRLQGGAARYALEYGAFFFWMAAWLLVRSFRGRPDVVYVNSPPDFFAVAALVAKPFGARVILDVHDPMPELFNAKGRRSQVVNKVLAFQERIGIAAADTLITVHEPLAELLQERSPDAEFSIVMNVPDPIGWPELTADKDSRLIVFTGTVAFRYGLDDLVRAIALVAADIPGIRLKVVGDGEDSGRLRELVRELGVADRVDLVGRVPYDEIRSQMDGAWIGANVPKPDRLGEVSFSNKVVEWVSIGLPVLASRTTTMERYFPDGTLLYTVGGDVLQIAESMRDIHSLSASDMAGHREAAKAALERIAWSVQRKKLLEVVASEATRSRRKRQIRP